MFRAPVLNFLSILSLAGWLALGGCDGKLPELPTVNDVKQAVQAPVEQIQQKVESATGTGGKIEWQLDKPSQSEGCYAVLLPQAAGRSTVLQVTSYRDPKAESFPSFFLRALVTQATAAELNGQQLPVQVFIQESADAPVWQSGDGQEGKLSFSTVDGQNFTGELNVTLFDDDGTRKEVSAKLAGSFLAK